MTEQQARKWCKQWMDTFSKGNEWIEDFIKIGREMGLIEKEYNHCQHGILKSLYCKKCKKDK